MELFKKNEEQIRDYEAEYRWSQAVVDHCVVWLKKSLYYEYPVVRVVNNLHQQVSFNFRKFKRPSDCATLQTTNFGKLCFKDLLECFDVATAKLIVLCKLFQIIGEQHLL